MSIIKGLLDIFQLNSNIVLSGTALGEKLGVSRAAIAKNIAKLNSLGYIIKATPKGYIYKPDCNLLSDALIRENLCDDLKSINISILPESPSTNTEAKLRCVDGGNDFDIILTRKQSKGRARNHKDFASPAGGIYMSVISMNNANFNSNVPAIALCETLKEYDLFASIQNSSSVMLNHKKCAGILTETIGDIESDRFEHIIMGIGIYLKDDQIIDSENTCALNIKELDVNLFVARLINHIYHIINMSTQKRTLIYQEYAH